MSKVAILTDSNSGLTMTEAENLGIHLLPMPFFINGNTHLEGVDLTEEEFYQQLSDNAEISTSMPAVSDVTDMWDRLLEDHEEVVYIPMSSGLSSSCETAIMLSQDYDGKVQVVNNQRISVTQKQSAIDAKTLASRGMNAAQIRQYLEDWKFESSIYIMVDTLYYLKKGGRITPAAAALGTLLKLKPVLQIQGEKLDAFAKARTIKQAKSIMIQAMLDDCKNRFGDEGGKTVHLYIAHTQNREAAEEFRKEIAEHFPDQEIEIDPLPMSIACHIGPGSLAIACSKRIDA